MKILLCCVFKVDKIEKKKYERCFVGAYNILKWWLKSKILPLEALLTKSALVCVGLQWFFFQIFMYPGIKKEVEKFHFPVFFKLTELNKKYQRCFVGAYNILKWWLKSKILLLEAFLTKSALVRAGLRWKFFIILMYLDTWILKKNVENSTLQGF